MSVAKGARKPKAKPDPYPPGWEPFLAAINARLDEDVPRLMFADWLQENGDEARAEFIRIQCAIEQADYSRDREADRLLADNRTRWCRGLPKWVLANDWNKFRRGFLASIKTTGARYELAAENLRRAAAIESLELSEPTPAAVAQPGIAGVRRLTAFGANRTVLTALADSPALPEVRDLYLTTYSEHNVTEDSILPVLSSGRLENLRRLTIHYGRAGTAIARVIATSGLRLEYLDLGQTALTAEGVSLLVQTPLAANLRSLCLSGNQFGIEGLQALISAPPTLKLTELHLSGCHILPETFYLLRNWPGLQSVRVLRLGLSQMDWGKLWDAIATSPNASSALTIEY